MARPLALDIFCGGVVVLRLYTGTDLETLWRRVGRCEQGAFVMIVKSSVKLSVSEVEVKEVIACFNA